MNIKSIMFGENVSLKVDLINEYNYTSIIVSSTKTH